MPENTVVRYCEGKIAPGVDRRAYIQDVLERHPVDGGTDLAYLWTQFGG